MRRLFYWILRERRPLCLPQVDRGGAARVAAPLEQTFDILLILGVFFSWAAGFSKGGQR